VMTTTFDSDTITRITPIMPTLWLCQLAYWIPCVAAWCG